MIIIKFQTGDILCIGICCCSVVKLCLTVCDPMDCSIAGYSPVHAFPSMSPWVYSNSSALNQWCHPAISSPVNPFSPCPQSFPASGSFQMSWIFTSGGQSIVASASVLPMNIQDWFPLWLTSLISLQSKGLPSIFSSTTIWKHQFFDAQPSLWFNSHICTWLLEKP